MRVVEEMHSKMAKYKVKPDVCEVASLLLHEQFQKSAQFDEQEGCDELLKKINAEIEAYKIVYQVQQEKDKKERDEEIAKDEERRR